MRLEEQIGQVVCAKRGHDWKIVGGRACPIMGRERGYGSPHATHTCTQTVYICSRCGLEDYGETGGPGHAECILNCKFRR